MFQSLAVLPQYLMPKRMLTALAGKFAGGARGNLTTAVIRWFIKRYGVNMAEAANPDPVSYATFNDFFTRSLCDGARTLADAAYVCPVDGAISQFGPIVKDQIYQAKGHRYSTTALLGGDSELAAHFANGEFAALLRARRAVFGQCDHRPRRARPVCAQRARGVRVRFARRAVRDGAGRRDHRR